MNDLSSSAFGSLSRTKGNRPVTLILLTLTTTSVWSSLARAQSFESVGALPGGAFSNAAAISSDGSVIAGFSDSSFGSRAYRWTSSGGMTALGVLPGGTSSDGFAISGDGTVIVGASDGTGFHTHAIRCTVGQPPDDLGAFTGGFYSIASGISRDGRIIVGTSQVSSSALRAFRHTMTGGMNPLNDPLGFGSTAYGANADGGVIVGSCSGGPNHPYQQACKWAPSANPAFLGSLAGDVTSIAYATNDDGQVIVGMSGSSIGIQRAVIWTSSGCVALDIPGGGWTGSLAYAVNAAGTLVAGEYKASSNRRACFWTDALGCVDLQRHLISLGANVGEWTLEYVKAVSADGLTLAGSGMHGSASFGWRATISSLTGPVLTSEPLGSYSPCAGQNAEFEVEANGTGPFAYQWQRRDPSGSSWSNLTDGLVPGLGNVDGATTQTLTVLALAPGVRAALRATITGSQSTIVSEAGFITVCAADFDCSGFTDIDDFGAFVTAFESGSEDADIDSSGFVDLDDFTEFVAAFESGC
jgi:probable HAF family extracellular repeat protein